MNIIDLKLQIAKLRQFAAHICHYLTLAVVMTKGLERIGMNDAVHQTHPREHAFFVRNELHVDSAGAKRSAVISS